MKNGVTSPPQTVARKAAQGKLIYKFLILVKKLTMLLLSLEFS